MTNAATMPQSRFDAFVGLVGDEKCAAKAPLLFFRGRPCCAGATDVAAVAAADAAAIDGCETCNLAAGFASLPIFADVDIGCETGGSTVVFAFGPVVGDEVVVCVSAVNDAA